MDMLDNLKVEIREFLLNNFTGNPNDELREKIREELLKDGDFALDYAKHCLKSVFGDSLESKDDRDIFLHACNQCNTRKKWEKIVELLPKKFYNDKEIVLSLLNNFPKKTERKGWQYYEEFLCKYKNFDFVSFQLKQDDTIFDKILDIFDKNILCSVDGLDKEFSETYFSEQMVEIYKNSKDLFKRFINRYDKYPMKIQDMYDNEIVAYKKITNNIFRIFEDSYSEDKDMLLFMWNFGKRVIQFYENAECEMTHRYVKLEIIDGMKGNLEKIVKKYSIQLKDNKDFILSAIDLGFGKNIHNIPTEFFKDENLVMHILKDGNDKLVNMIPEDCLTDDIILKSAENGFKSINDKLEDPEICLRLLKISEKALRYISPDLIENHRFMVKAFDINPEVENEEKIIKGKLQNNQKVENEKLKARAERAERRADKLEEELDEATSEEDPGYRSWKEMQ